MHSSLTSESKHSWFFIGLCQLFYKSNSLHIFFFIACIPIVNQAPLDEDWVHSPMVSECQHSCFFIGWSKLGGSLDILTGSMGPQTSKFSHSCNPYGMICMSYRTQKACASDAGFVGKLQIWQPKRALKEQPFRNSKDRQ